MNTLKGIAAGIVMTLMFWAVLLWGMVELVVILVDRVFRAFGLD